MTTTATTVEAVQQTLAEYERQAISTGEPVQIDPPQFSSTGRGEDWSPVWAGEESPTFARATVYRGGVPTTVYVSWYESLPAVDEWRELWLRKPMKLFGAYTIRTALRRAYRDVIGDRHEPDETEVAAPAAPVAAAPRDWPGDLAKATTPDAVQSLHREAKAARAVTVELETAIRRRLATLKAGVTVGASIKDAVERLTTAGQPDAAPVAEVVEHRAKFPAVTPADLAAAIAKRPLPVPPQSRGKNGRRPQKPKARQHD